MGPHLAEFQQGPHLSFMQLAPLGSIGTIGLHGHHSKIFLSETYIRSYLADNSN